jgi:hypothetical protein
MSLKKNYIQKAKTYGIVGQVLQVSKVEGAQVSEAAKSCFSLIVATDRRTKTTKTASIEARKWQGFYPSRIPDPKTASKERDEKKFVLHFFVATNITKLEIIFLHW